MSLMLILHSSISAFGSRFIPRCCVENIERTGLIFTMVDIEELKRKYEEKWVPENYIEKYVNPQFSWEYFLVPKLHEAVERGKIKGIRGIDIGCGPTVHRAAILSKACDEILMCDYTQSNLNFMRKWLKAEQPAGLLTDSFKIASQLEGFQDIKKGEEMLSERLRAKLKHVVHCDLTNSESVLNLLQFGGQFDFAYSNGCVEAACSTEKSYVDILKRIASLLKPGAAFAMSGYLTADYYYVGDVKFECFYLTQDTVQNGLEAAGFKVDTIELAGDVSDTIENRSNCRGAFFSISYRI